MEKRAFILPIRQGVSDVGWFAALPSGTDDIGTIYAESFEGPDHMRSLQAEAQQIVDTALAG